jgi:hypothetical protein
VGAEDAICSAFWRVGKMKKTVDIWMTVMLYTPSAGKHNQKKTWVHLIPGVLLCIFMALSTSQVEVAHSETRAKKKA